MDPEMTLATRLGAGGVRCAVAVAVERVERWSGVEWSVARAVPSREDRRTDRQAGRQAGRQAQKCWGRGLPNVSGVCKRPPSQASLPAPLPVPLPASLPKSPSGE
jgi:hypothetical protein